MADELESNNNPEEPAEEEEANLRGGEASDPPARGRKPEWPGVTPKQGAFLSALVANGGQHGKAAKAANLTRQSHYQWMKTDEHYQELHRQAMIQVTVVLEDEAIRRAIDGQEKGIYYQGQQCGTELVHSDGLMMFLLRAADPEKYRERSDVKAKVDVTHKFSGTMEELLATYREIVSKESQNAQQT